MDTLIFPNQLINIDDIYQPLNLTTQGFDRNESFNISDYPNELFEKFNKVIVVDNAGMGKSTLSKFISVSSIKSEQKIPIFIELRKIDKKNKLIDEILNQLNSIDEIFDEDFIFKLLKMGEFLIVLDGYDEINSEDQRLVTDDIREFVSKTSDNLFLLTSRPEGSLSTFGDFQRIKIKGLRKQEAFDLLSKYDSISKKQLSVKLISEINTTNHQIQDFLSNPFLVSLLYKTYSFKRDIPSRKSTFYNEVYTALYQDHDLSKNAYKRDKFSKLDIQDFRLVLREFAILTSQKSKVGYSEIEALDYISKSKKKVPFLVFKESSFLKDLITTVPLFIKDGNNFRWSHKSIQDYFSAEYITYHPKKDEIINHIFKNDFNKYYNIIDLVFELDPNLIRHHVLPDFLKNLISHFNNVKDYEEIPTYEIQFRKALTFNTYYWCNKSKSLISDTKYDEFKRVSQFISENFDLNVDNATEFNFNILISLNRKNFASLFQYLGSNGFLGESIFEYDKGLVEIDADKFTAQPILIDGNDDNAFYNNPENYPIINRLLLHASVSNMNMDNFFIPDIAYCKELLISLTDEIQTNSKNNFLNDY